MLIADLCCFYYYSYSGKWSCWLSVIRNSRCALCGSIHCWYAVGEELNSWLCKSARKWWKNEKACRFILGSSCVLDFVYWSANGVVSSRSTWVHEYVFFVQLGFMLLALIWQFDFSPFMVLIIAILNDGEYLSAFSWLLLLMQWMSSISIPNSKYYISPNLASTNAPRYAKRNVSDHHLQIPCTWKKKYKWRQFDFG